MTDQGAAKGVARDIHDMIRTYCANKDPDTKEVLKKLDDTIRALKNPHKFTVSALRETGCTASLEAAFFDVVRQWQSRRKDKAAKELKKFSDYLHKECGIVLDESELPQDIPDVTERRLDMLKYLQVPRSMEDLEKQYLTSDRTVRSDLTQLVNGWELLGNRIRIKREDADGKISYNSTAHPVMLPLNLTEVYALAVGFPKLAQGTVYEGIAKYLADAVYMQLSEYAAGILAKTDPGIRGRMIPKGCDSRRKRSSLEYRQEEFMLERSRVSWLIYVAKQCQMCRIRYDDGHGDVRQIEGIPSLGHDDMHYIGLRGTQELIPLDRIVSFERLEAYR